MGFLGALLCATASTPASAEPNGDEEGWHDAEFSGKRWVVEVLTGALAGTLSAVVVYNAAGGGTEGAIAGTATSFAVTPLVEWGVGTVMGSRGSLGWTYVGGLVGFSASTPAAGNPTADLIVAEIVLPICSGLFNEMSSNLRARHWESDHELGVALRPVNDRHGALGGAALTVGLRF